MLGTAVTQVLSPRGNYPARACAVRGYVIGRGVYILYIGLVIKPGTERNEMERNETKRNGKDRRSVYSNVV